MNNNSVVNFPKAVQDFRDARRAAAMQQVIGKLTGQSTSLLSFDEIKNKIPLSQPGRKFLDNIPLDSIIGSVGRYEDFNRKFLPVMDADVERWARVKIVVENTGFPPIDVYKIGQAYFVLDGNHRVSIARQLDMPTIEGWVTEFRTPVEITPEDDLDDVLLKAEYVEFCQDTGLNRLFPDIDFRVTVPGRYPQLTEHIHVHQYFLGLERRRDIPYEEAVISWVKNVYSPFVDLIRHHGVLRDFPGRTETDLYLWLKKHHAELSEELGWNIEEERAIIFISRELGRRPRQIIRRWKDRLYKWIMPEEFEAGPPPGEWRNPDEVNRLDDRLFSSILVPLGKGEDDWIALAQALPIARRENAVIKGLHVISEGEDIDSVQVQQVREGFDDRCQEGGVTGQFVVERGKVSNLIVERAAWNDLVVMHLAHPPQPNPIARFRSGFRSVVQRAPRPIIAVSTVSQKLERTLLAFDGSPKAEEALFLSAYVANYWNSDLIVLTSTRNRASTRKSEKRACDYLEEQGIRATFVSRQGDPGEMIVETARDYNVDLVIMGGYGRGPIRAMLFGSALETVLRSQGPLTLICR